MSYEAYQQFQTLVNAMQEHHTYDRMDRWIYDEGTLKYSSQHSYKHMAGNDWVHRTPSTNGYGNQSANQSKRCSSGFY
jgi:hypothetical protein